jgi:DeoR/GlpR family transcriptional regulator of sugar metabolism
MGITGNDYDESEMSRALIEQSGEVVATVTAEKLDTVAPFVVAPIEALTHIVTEEQVLDEKLASYQAMGIQIIKAAK